MFLFTTFCFYSTVLRDLPYLCCCNMFLHRFHSFGIRSTNNKWFRLHRPSKAHTRTHIGRNNKWNCIRCLHQSRVTTNNTNNISVSGTMHRLPIAKFTHCMPMHFVHDMLARVWPSFLWVWVCICGSCNYTIRNTKLTMKTTMKKRGEYCEALANKTNVQIASL